MAQSIAVGHQIQAFGGIAGKNHILPPRRMDELRHPGPGILIALRGLKA